MGFDSAANEWRLWNASVGNPKINLLLVCDHKIDFEALQEKVLAGFQDIFSWDCYEFELLCVGASKEKLWFIYNHLRTEITVKGKNDTECYELRQMVNLVRFDSFNIVLRVRV